MVEKLREAAIYRKKGLIKIFIYFFNKINSSIEKYIISKNLTLVNGSCLYNKYRKNSQHLYKIITSSIWEKEILKKIKKDIKPPYCIIYVGRLSAVKGIFDLFQVIKRLNQFKYNARLLIVGYPGKQKFYLKFKRQLMN